MHAPPRPSPALPRSPSRTPARPVAIRTGLLLAAVFGVLLALVACAWEPLVSLDRYVAQGLHPVAVEHHGWTRCVRVLSDWLWDPWTMRAALAVAVLWLARRRDWLLCAWIAGTSALGTALQQGLKAAVGRARPSWPDPVATAHYAAFPSGHALTATVTCGLLVWLLWRHGVRAAGLRAALAAGAVSVLGVGFTRLYLGVHWLSDVVGGWLLGGALVAVSAALFETLAGRRATEAEGAS
ncbi:phosphatase PAP2 family protein [Streptomyces roseoverticillatus]|uniref:phosphatase PAP2 family protein n=1 Tax=Streptomyces roseoverticillatus TaxID=66429 RepID=UPI001F3DC54D|nr:phosphatase PAP2 family protein [Streptomyces roseoverticillatus]MCF3103717.1 phosphatase PAP2 family protein [Streptomyces roseoverticillatus]